jgi:carbohydrate kinase (thermoresistant glucokinase family)
MPTSYGQSESGQSHNRQSPSVPPIIVMGVQGSGKTTIGELLAARLGVPLVDGDSLHSKENKQWMASGRALSDAQRLPWLNEVGDRLALGAGSGVVLACSALKRSYRDLLRDHAPTMLTVFARGDIDLIRARIGARQHEYMPPSLLRTQFDDLEERQDDEPGVTVDIADTPEQIVQQVIELITGEGTITSSEGSKNTSTSTSTKKVTTGEGEACTGGRRRP